jgi:hypothetical protein
MGEGVGSLWIFALKMRVGSGELEEVGSLWVFTLKMRVAERGTPCGWQCLDFYAENAHRQCVHAVGGLDILSRFWRRGGKRGSSLVHWVKWLIGWVGNGGGWGRESSSR